jgi:hypothetical protein
MVLNSSAATCGGLPIPLEAKIQPAWLGFGLDNKLGHRPRGRRRIDTHHERRAGDLSHGLSVLNEVEPQVSIESSIDGIRGRRHQHGVAVSRRAYNLLGRNIRCRPRPIFDDEGRAELPG